MVVGRIAVSPSSGWRFKVILKSPRSSYEPRPLLPPRWFEVCTKFRAKFFCSEGKKRRKKRDDAGSNNSCRHVGRYTATLWPSSPANQPALCVFSCCSAWFQSEEKAPPPLPDASVRLFSIRFCVSPVFYLSNLSSSPSALPPLASRLSRLPSSFHSSPIPIFNLYPLSRRHHSGSARPSFTLFFAPLSPLCAFFFLSHPLKLHYWNLVCRVFFSPSLRRSLLRFKQWEI